MLTRCPHCRTTFRVTPDQLKIRQGRVRCGSCQAVFNALDSLEEEVASALPATAVPAVEPPAATATPDVPAEDRGPDTRPAPEPEPVPEPEIELRLEPTLAEPSAPAAVEPDPEPAPEPAIEAVPETIDAVETLAAPEHLEETPQEPAVSLAESSAMPAPLPVDEPPPPAMAEPLPEPEPTRASEPLPGLTPPLPELETYAEELPARRRWPWVLGSLLALVLLALQAAIHYRVELAVVAPEARPVLKALCDLAGLDLPLPARIEFVGIETSDLHPDPAKPGHFLLMAGLHNRAPFAQRWPDLELTLTDALDQALVRRVLAPADYLPAELAGGAGFAARGEQTLRLAVDAPGIAAVGYRLYVFYP